MITVLILWKIIVIAILMYDAEVGFRTGGRFFCTKLRCLDESGIRVLWGTRRGGDAGSGSSRSCVLSW